MSSSQAMQKILIRKDMKKRLNELLNDRGNLWLQEQSQEISAKVLSTPEYKKSQTVSVFLSMPHEVQTKAILNDIFSSGKRCFVPIIRGDMEMVEVTALQVLDNLPRDKWGIPSFESIEGLSVAKPGEIDLMIMPGLAFDQERNRLGYGKGYFDKYITRNHPKAKIAVSLDEQVLGSVPQENHDIKVDKIITPNTLIK